MIVDDHDLMCGGLENTLTVRLTAEEVQQLLSGKILTGKNEQGCKTTVKVMVRDNPTKTSAS